MMFKPVFAGALLLAGVQALAATPAATVSAFHAAMKAGDQSKVLALLSPRAVIYEAGYVERSRDEYASHHLPSDIGFAKATERKLLQQSERTDGSLAVVFEETETSGKFNGAPVHAFGTETMVLERSGDGWLIAHVHWSSRKAK